MISDEKTFDLNLFSFKIWWYLIIIFKLTYRVDDNNNM